MKKMYMQEIKQVFRSAEYRFSFILIVISAACTAIYNLDSYGVFYSTEIGAAEFFCASILFGNTLLQISAPIIPLFASMHSSGIYSESQKNSVAEGEHTTVSRVLSTITIGASVFFFSFLLIALVGIIFFPSSTGDINDIGGPFCAAYYENPFSIIPLTIIFSCIFACAYSLLGMGIGLNLKRNKLFAFFVPLTFYFSFTYIAQLTPSVLRNVLYWIVPIDTFRLASTNIPLYKKAIEILFVLVLGIVLIIIAEKRTKKVDCNNKRRS